MTDFFSDLGDIIDPCGFTDFDGDGTHDITETMAAADWYDEDNSKYDDNYNSDYDENFSEEFDDDNEREDENDY